MEDITLTPQEAAVRLRIHIDSLYTMVKRRQLPHFKLGRRIFFKSKALDEWIELQMQNSVIPQVVEGAAGALRRA